MFDPARLPLFFAASLVLLVTPGPAVLYIVTRSATQGRVAGLVSVASVEVGNLVHVLAAALGLSAILLTSSVAYGVVKYLGAAYLIYLGLRKLFGRAPASGGAVMESQPLSRVFGQGVLVAVLNPKTALFFLAFLPQFADPARGSMAVQLAVLGCAFVAMAVVTDSLYAILAAGAGKLLSGRKGVAAVSRYVTGGVYIGLGLTAALTGRRP